MKSTNTAHEQIKGFLVCCVGSKGANGIGDYSPPRSPRTEEDCKGREEHPKRLHLMSRHGRSSDMSKLPCDWACAYLCKLTCTSERTVNPALRCRAHVFSPPTLDVGLGYPSAVTSVVQPCVSLNPFPASLCEKSRLHQMKTPKSKIKQGSQGNVGKEGKEADQEGSESPKSSYHQQWFTGDFLLDRPISNSESPQREALQKTKDR